MIRGPPRSTLDRSSAASDVYKRQVFMEVHDNPAKAPSDGPNQLPLSRLEKLLVKLKPVSYTHLRAHETVLDLVCRLLLEKQNNLTERNAINIIHHE